MERASHKVRRRFGSARERGAGRCCVGLCIVAWLAATCIGGASFVAAAQAETSALTPAQSDALKTYTTALNAFAAILAQRRAQLTMQQKLPGRPGQALYLARLAHDERVQGPHRRAASRSGGPTIRIPPAYFDADTEPLIEEYINSSPPCRRRLPRAKLPRPLQGHRRPLHGNRARQGSRRGKRRARRPYQSGHFLRRDQRQPEHRQRALEYYKGSLQTGVSEDRNGRRKWAAIKSRVAALDPALAARDAKEEARAGNRDHRFNHWTAVRNGLMNAHAELFPQIPRSCSICPTPSIR